jgi:predicted nucleic acid-binding protein
MPLIRVELFDYRMNDETSAALIEKLTDALDESGEARNAIARIRELQPSILINDRLPRAGDFDGRSLWFGVVALSLVAAAIASGADGLVTRDVSWRQVVDAIHVVVTGTRVMVMGSQSLGLGREFSAGRLRLGWRK